MKLGSIPWGGMPAAIVAALVTVFFVEAVDAQPDKLKGIRRSWCACILLMAGNDHSYEGRKTRLRQVASCTN